MPKGVAVTLEAEFGRIGGSSRGMGPGRLAGWLGVQLHGIQVSKDVMSKLGR